MAKDPTQGPVSTYDAEGNPIKTNVEETPIEEAVEETAVDESTVAEEVEEAIAEETVEEVAEDAPEEEASEDTPEEEASEDDVEPEEEEEEEEPFEAHEHEVDAPLTYADAEKQLKETSYAKLKEMAVADGLKPERSTVKIVAQLLNHWFAEPPSFVGSEPQMSVRVRRIYEAGLK